MSASTPCPTFTPKHEWSFQNNAICGITLGAWLETLSQRWRHIDWRLYWQRVLFITLIAIFNSLLAIVESVLYGRTIERQKLNTRPLFVLGHPRTGTTLLHNLLALDTESFGWCSTFCAGFPSSFLWFERFKWLLAGMVDDKRPMDDMELSLDVPQEDEIGVAVLSAGRSPYFPLFFMTAEPSFRPFFTFLDAEPSDTARWVDSFKFLLRKLTVRAGGDDRRLLLKSPAHTARVELLLQLFPDAQFVYIHRHPEVVYQSAVHMADTTYWYMYLARPTDAQIHDFILCQFELLWQSYDDARKAIPPGRLVELSYTELTADPAAAIARIYDALGLPGFEERMRDRVVAHTRRPAVQGHRKNKFAPLEPKLRALVARRWAAYTEAWGYVWEGLEADS